MSQPTGIASFLRAKLVQLEMVRDRGYVINERQRSQITELRKWLKQQSKLPSFYVNGNLNRKDWPEWLNEKYIRLNPTSGEVMDTLNVYFIESPQRISDMVIGDITNNGDYPDNAIIITAQPLTPPKLKQLSGIEGTHIMVFGLTELQVNPKRHFYQPRFRRLSIDERAKFLRTNAIASSKLPLMIYSSIKNPDKKLLFSDPIVKYYDFRPEDIIEIETETFQVPVPITSNLGYDRVHGS